MTKYRLTIIEDPDGIYLDRSIDFNAISDNAAKIYAKGLMSSYTKDPQNNIGHLKKYSSKTNRYRRIGVFRPAFMGGYDYVSERRS